MNSGDLKNILPEKLYLAEQVREMDRIAIEQQGILGIDLMRKAGAVVFDTIEKHYSAFDIVVFCGVGNNAGDGYVIAKLALDAGIKVKVYHLSKCESLKGDAVIAYQDYIVSAGKVTAFDINISLNQCVVVDALLGTGLNRDVSGDYADAITLINNTNNPVVSVDIPSGLNADTGMVMGNAVKADTTVSFIGLKQGMFTGFAAEYCGKIVFSSLDIADEVLQQVEYSSRLISHCSIPKRHQCAHKGNNGHLLLVGGDDGFSGAIRLAAEAALRTGAGLVTVATRKSHASFINMGRPELMCYGVEQANELIPLLNKASVVVVGPGLGKTQWANDLFELLIGIDKPIVCDADGLTLLADKKLKKERWILTPHPGEAARLLACSTADIAKDRFKAVLQLQKNYGGVVVLKGAGTLVYNGEEIAVSTTGNPGMASGGMGDALAGIVGGMLAQHVELYAAAKFAVYLHGKAADLSAQQDGEIGMLASDLLPFIRQLINE